MDAVARLLTKTAAAGIDTRIYTRRYAKHVDGGYMII